MKSSFLILSSIAAFSSQIQAQTYQPYINGDATHDLLSFNAAADSSLAAPLSSLGLVLAYNTNTSYGSGGGWNLESKGSANIGANLGLAVVALGSTQATTTTGDGTLTFGTSTSGLSSLAGLNLPMAWEASTSVPGSSAWLLGAGDTVTYNFTLDFNNGLLGLGVGVLPSIGLEISDDSGILFSGSNAGALLGLTNLTNSSNAGSVSFNYNPTNGPIEIKWYGSQTVSAGLFGTGSDVYKISKTGFDVTPVPEPSSSLLLGFGALSLLSRRSRQ